MKRALLTISLVLLLVALLAWLPGCGGDGESADSGKAGIETGEEEAGTTESGGTADSSQPEDTVTAFWAALSSGDVAGALSYCSDTMRTRALKNLFTTFFSGEGGEYGADVQQFMAGLDLKPVGSEVRGDKATVVTEVTGPDLEQIDLIFDQMMTLSIDMAEAEDYSNLTPQQIIQQFTLEFVKLLNTLPTATAGQDISLVWEDEAWKIASDPFEDLEQYFIVFQGES